MTKINATRETRTEQVVVERPVIVLELSENQAQMLYDLLGQFTGSFDGPRGFFSDLYEVLQPTLPQTDYFRRQLTVVGPAYLRLDAGPGWVNND